MLIAADTPSDPAAPAMPEVMAGRLFGVKMFVPDGPDQRPVLAHPELLKLGARPAFVAPSITLPVP